MIRPPKSRLRGLQVGMLEGPPKKTKRGAEAEEDRLVSPGTLPSLKLSMGLPFLSYIPNQPQGPSRSSLQR